MNMLDGIPVRSLTMFPVPGEPGLQEIVVVFEASEPLTVRFYGRCFGAVGVKREALIYDFRFQVCRSSSGTMGSFTVETPKAQPAPHITAQALDRPVHRSPWGPG